VSICHFIFFCVPTHGTDRAPCRPKFLANRDSLDAQGKKQRGNWGSLGDELTELDMDRSGSIGRRRRTSGRRRLQPGDYHGVCETVSWCLRNRDGKRDGDSMGMTSKRAREWQNGKETTRRTRWWAHLWPKINDGDRRARRSCGGVAGVGEDDGVDVGIERSTTPRRRARREKLSGGVRSHRQSTVSPEKLAGV
jgi:hypothetical protein